MFDERAERERFEEFWKAYIPLTAESLNPLKQFVLPFWMARARMGAERVEKVLNTITSLPELLKKSIKELEEVK